MKLWPEMASLSDSTKLLSYCGTHHPRILKGYIYIIHALPQNCGPMARDLIHAPRDWWRLESKPWKEVGASQVGTFRRSHY